MASFDGRGRISATDKIRRSVCAFTLKFTIHLIPQSSHSKAHPRRWASTLPLLSWAPSGRTAVVSVGRCLPDLVCLLNRVLWRLLPHFCHIRPPSCDVDQPRN